MSDTSSTTPTFDTDTGCWTLAPFITKASDGYVYWRDTIPVEHFTFSDSRRDAELQSALRLSKRCLHLEAIGIPVNWNTVLRESCYGAPADSPWLKVLPRIYTLFKESEAVAGIFWTPARKAVVVIKRPSTSAERLEATHDYGADASQAVQALGFQAQPAVNYDAVASTLQAFELLACDLETMIDS